MRNKTVLIDLDDVICTESKDIERCLPKEHVIESLNALKSNRNYIIIQTTRSISQLKFTVEWLRINKIPYDYITFGVPSADIHIGKIAYRYNGWHEFMKKVYNTEMNTILNDPINVYERVLYENLKFIMDDSNGLATKRVKKAMERARKAIEV